MSSVFDFDAFEATPLQRDPFDHIVVPGMIHPKALQAIRHDYPAIADAGTYPIDGLSYGPAFKTFWEEVQGPALREAIARKFGLDLAGHPVMATARTRCEASDGAIHTDSKTKVITGLFYFNEGWPHAGGRLRFLRSPDDLEDYAAEVLPLGGTFLAFHPCGHSYHGHLPFDGERRMVQMHYVDPKRVEKNRRKRRSLGWRLKKALSAG